MLHISHTGTNPAPGDRTVALCGEDYIAEAVDRDDPLPVCFRCHVATIAQGAVAMTQNVMIMDHFNTFVWNVRNIHDAAEHLQDHIEEGHFNQDDDGALIFTSGCAALNPVAIEVMKISKGVTD
jgi:hypothetical protein